MVSYHVVRMYVCMYVQLCTHFASILRINANTYDRANSKERVDRNKRGDKEFVYHAAEFVTITLYLRSRFCSPFSIQYETVSCVSAYMYGKIPRDQSSGLRISSAL